MKIFPLTYHPDSDFVFTQLQGFPGRVWLDSGKPDSTQGRYDILSALPSEVVEPNLSTAEAILGQRLNHSADASHGFLPFTSGWIGYFPYEFRHQYFQLHTPSQPSTAWFGWYDWAVIVDHQLQQSHLLFTDTCTDKTYRTITSRLQKPHLPLPPVCGSVRFRRDVTQDDYLKAIDSIHKHLLAGDCYQVNLSQRFSAPFGEDAVNVYRTLRKVVPSPYSAFIDTGTLQIISISPERFVSLNQDKVIAQPIKGTVPRLRDALADEKQRHALQTSEKNRAENVMIVDLLRNDLSQHCTPGSVKTPKLFEVQSFANVHHLVSTVEGHLPAEINPIQFLLDCFPGGSITGAPKKRSMEIINRLEPHRRGPYCGSIGYLTHGRRFDFNIAIRTLAKQDQQLFAWAGGGIVIDSDAADEYQETLNKISVFLDQLNT